MENKLKKLAAKHFSEQEIESVKFIDGKVIVTLQNSVDDEKKTKALKKEIEKLDEVKKVFIVYTGHKKEEKIQKVKTVFDKMDIKGVKKFIAVASGKGGVGKSTTAVNLALALANQNLKVGIFDADIYGPSIPTMLGIEGLQPVTLDGKFFQPFSHMGIKSMSIGTLIDKSQPLVWRGVKACAAIEQLLGETEWGGLDVMVIDMPPGTGDVQIGISQKIKLDGAVIVSTPQDIALIDAVKGVNMFKMVDVPILGIIENMSYYVCEKCGNRADIFGHEGAKKTAEDMGVDFLGEIPLNIKIRQDADNGTPIVMAEPEGEYTKIYESISKKIAAKLFLPR